MVINEGWGGEGEGGRRGRDGIYRSSSVKRDLFPFCKLIFSLFLTWNDIKLNIYDDQLLLFS